MYLEDVFDALQGNGDDAGVGAGEQVAQRLDGARAHQVLDLVVAAARGRVADGPRRFLLDVKLRLAQHVHQRQDQVRIYHRLRRRQSLILKPPSLD